MNPPSIAGDSLFLDYCCLIVSILVQARKGKYLFRVTMYLQHFMTIRYMRDILDQKKKKKIFERYLGILLTMYVSDGHSVGFLPIVFLGKVSSIES